MSIFDDLLITIDDQSSLSLSELQVFFPEISCQQISSTLGRLVGRGWLEVISLGNGQRYRLTPTGNATINTTLSYIRVREEAWAGEWFWVVASLPEVKRRERDLLRLELNRQGFGRLIDGLYLHPRDRKDLITDLIRRFGIGSSVYIFENKHLGQGSNQILINQAWNWPILAAKLETFLLDAERQVEELSRLSRQVTSRLERQNLRLTAKKLVFAYGQLLTGDPNLPLAVLPIKEPYQSGQKFYQNIRRYCYL